MSVELRRVHSNVFKKKPKVILENKHFKQFKDMEIGSKGQLDAILRVVEVEDVREEHENTSREIMLRIESADPINANSHKEFK